MRIYFDIETLPTSRSDIQARVTADVAPPGQYKKAESIAQWWASQGEQEKAEAVAKTALNGTWGELFCLGFAVEDGPVTVLSRSDGGVTEADLLRAFGAALQAAVEAQSDAGQDIMWDRRAVWIGHNIDDFDIRFLFLRSVINGVKLPFALPLERYKHGPYSYDTMREWAGWSGRVKQSDIELALGLERVDTIDGSQVWEKYREGDYGSIVKHCEEDVRLLREIYKRMTFNA